MDKSYLIDTSSLINLVRYYIFFDAQQILSKKIEQLFNNGTLILLQPVLQESKFVAKGKARKAKGIVVEKLPFLEKINPRENKIATAEQHIEIDDHWVVEDRKEKLDPSSYIDAKKRAIEGADFQLIFHAIDNKQDIFRCAIVTEETETANDNKRFKKIPAICNDENVDCITLPKLLDELGFSTSYKFLNNTADAVVVRGG